MKIKEYLQETTTSAGIDSYDVPFADGKGKHKTNIPPIKRTKNNIPLDKKKKPLVKMEDWLKIDKE